ncbi:hypothetical protein ACQKCH_13135 [Nubsella zeaxanthinifaciens]|uniref:hypothetical protein n=1 Tax=Nubsella zeaxanthinifaciens TaxID=392412 RepID=UPI003CFC133B
MAKERVKTRVIEGGHDIPSNVIERRYVKGVKNLFDIYLNIVDGAFIFDNSIGRHQLIAQKTVDEFVIINESKFIQLKQSVL